MMAGSGYKGRYSGKILFFILLVAVAVGSFWIASLFVKSDGPAQGVQSNIESVAASAEIGAQGLSNAIWAKRCSQESPKSCEIFRRLTMKANNQTLIEVAFNIPVDGGEAPRAAIVLPLGITMDRGFGIQVDAGEQYNAAVKTCNQGGCFALVNLPDGFLDSMLSGTSLNVLFLDGAGKPVKVEITLKGFAQKWSESLGG